MRLVRKVSRKRYFSKAVYVHERVLIPIPAKYRELVKPLLGRELDVSVEAEGDGLSIRVKPVNTKSLKGL